MTAHLTITPRESLARLARCTDKDLGSAQWWSCLVSNLDELHAELAQADVAGLIDQVTQDAPHMAATAHRLELLDAQVRAEVVGLRRMADGLAGSVTGARTVRDALERVLRRVRSLHRITDDLMLDAYERDFGGE